MGHPSLVAGAIIRRGYRQKDADYGAVIVRVIPALNLNLASVTFDKLLGDEQADASAHGTAGGEECFEHSWQIIGCNPDAVILDGQQDSIP